MSTADQDFMTPLTVNSNGTGRPADRVKLPILGRLLRVYLKSRLRGSTRMTYLLARHFQSLQQCPLDIPGWAPVYIDLRMSNAHVMLMQSPYNGLWRELDEVEIMRRFVQPGDVVFDIGANVGLHSILLSHLVGSEGQLFAFEPNAELLRALKFTIAQLGNAKLHPIALSNREAESQLFVPPDDSVASLADWTLASPIFNQDGPAHIVKCTEHRMDNLIEAGLIPQPDFIKCDVEGGELQVFQGAHNALDRVDAPIILFEVNECASRAFGFDVSAARDFLAALQSPSYRFFEIRAGGDLANVEELSPSFTSMIAVPKSKLSQWPETRGARG